MKVDSKISLRSDRGCIQFNGVMECDATLPYCSMMVHFHRNEIESHVIIIFFPTFIPFDEYAHNAKSNIIANARETDSRQENQLSHGAKYQGGGSKQWH
jgi:hypothetical protein